MIKRLENVGIVVEDLDATIEFFEHLGLTTQGRGTFEGDWMGRIVGLDDVKLDIAMMRTPDGNGRLELMRYHRPTAVSGAADAPVHALGIRRILFAVDNIDTLAEGIRARGWELLGELANVEGDSYRFCYIRGPEGIIVALAEQLS
ncbi:VOC family protein [Kibdelosporangium philippinense]|uniref:VOC family protein n=1 Tax=Kibdelosporangium philippinense TaxID=211113 RepID=A0ABS8ZXH2_9PSEU|nr:VOC family protein [Kibdelosporangium philippinense]MCE7012088.1 VOC family protein [Kibdelosporangium philippinense]